MKLIFFFFATSALFIAQADAIPMLSFGSQSEPSAPGPLDPNQVPKVDFGTRMSKNDKTAAKDLIIDHYKGLEPGNEQKQARLAFVQYKWIDGVKHDDQHRQYINFNYHRGDKPDSARIGQTETVARDRPPPESHFSNEILNESKPELIKQMNKKYETLPPDVAKHVRSMKVQKDWADGPGLREETQITFHSYTVPTVHNVIGNPVTIYRPMSFLIRGAVPKGEIPAIKKRVREEHEKLDENHPLKQANYGIVNGGWHKVKGESKTWVKQVETNLYKVKDQLSYNAERDYERIGDFRVTLGRGRLTTSGGKVSTATRRKRKAAASVPDVSTPETSSPSLS